MSTQTPTERPAWSREDLEESPHEHAEKASRVQSMFTAIAPAYDLNNSLHSFGRDKAWRRRAVKLTGMKAGEEVLDVACGTGPLSEAFLAAGASRVIGLDYTPGHARHRTSEGHATSGWAQAGVRAWRCHGTSFFRAELRCGFDCLWYSPMLPTRKRRSRSLHEYCGPEVDWWCWNSPSRATPWCGWATPSTPGTSCH